MDVVVAKQVDKAKLFEAMDKDMAHAAAASA